MSQNQPNILIAAPISSRGWCLSHYLDHLYNLSFPKSQLSFYFLLNNSTDNSREILLNFKKQHDHEYNSIYIDTFPTPKEIPQDQRSENIRKRYIYQHLSNLRNQIFNYAKEGNFTHLYSVDSDILVKPDSLTRLLEHNANVVSSLIFNGYKFRPQEYWKFPNILKRKPDGKFEHISNYYVKNAEHLPEGKLLRVNATGAVSLISRDVFSNTSYSYDDQGEDIFWSVDCEKKGYELWCDTGVFSHHIMDQQMLEEYLASQKQK